MYVLYIPVFIFAFLMLFSGIVSLLWPAKWEDREEQLDGEPYRKNRPGYFGGHAKDSREMWEAAQKIYGKYSIIMGILQILLAIPEFHLLVYVCKYLWEKEDATIPVMLITILPAFILIGLIHLFTEIELNKQNHD